MPSGCPELVEMKILWAIYSLLLIRIWDSECVAYSEILEGHNNVIHKSSPTPCLCKRANYIKSADEPGSTRVCRTLDQKRGEELNLLEKWSQEADLLSGSFHLPFEPNRSSAEKRHSRTSSGATLKAPPEVLSVSAPTLSFLALSTFILYEVSRGPAGSPILQYT